MARRREASGNKEIGQTRMTAPHLLIASPDWTTTFPCAVAGVLVMRGVVNPTAHPALDAVRERLETSLRDRYAGKSRAEIRATGHFPTYDAYYRRFGQTYHVLMQVDSVVNKGKSIPRRAALVEAAFMAELSSGILTASHDLGQIAGPITVDVTGKSDEYRLYNDAPHLCKPGDMVMRDRRGILSSVIAGPAAEARITPATTSVVFCVYAPEGIGKDAVRAHLQEIEASVRLLAPDAEAEEIILSASE